MSSKKGRKPLVLDKIEFQKQLSDLENSRSFSSRQQLWIALAETPWAKGLQPRPLTSQVAMNFAQKENIVIKTIKGVKGNIGSVSRTSNKRKSRTIPLDVLQEVKQVYPKKYENVLSRFSAGSLKAAVKLKCLDCSGLQQIEIKLCEIKSCPLWNFRPYK